MGYIYVVTCMYVEVGLIPSLPYTICLFGQKFTFLTRPNKCHKQYMILCVFSRRRGEFYPVKMEEMKPQK